MLDLRYLATTAVKLRELFDCLWLLGFKGSRYFENLVLESIEKKLVLLGLECLLDSGLFIDRTEELIMRLYEGVSDQRPANRTGDRLVGVQLEHPLDAVIAEEVSIGTGQHWPSSHDMVRLEADVAEEIGRTFPMTQARQSMLNLMLIIAMLFIHCSLTFMFIKSCPYNLIPLKKKNKSDKIFYNTYDQNQIQEKVQKDKVSSIHPINNLQ